jgi:hypothetical protein
MQTDRQTCSAKNALISYAPCKALVRVAYRRCCEEICIHFHTFFSPSRETLSLLLKNSSCVLLLTSTPCRCERKVSNPCLSWLFLYHTILPIIFVSYLWYDVCLCFKILYLVPLVVVDMIHNAEWTEVHLCFDTICFISDRSLWYQMA